MNDSTQPTVEMLRILQRVNRFMHLQKCILHNILRIRMIIGITISNGSSPVIVYVIKIVKRRFISILHAFYQFYFSLLHIDFTSFLSLFHSLIFHYTSFNFHCKYLYLLQILPKSLNKAINRPVFCF